jgi:hypothetical protein
MPWLETDPVTERKRFILEAEGGLFSHAELCRRHNISRRTGYKWLERYEADGPDGLLDRSHRPRSCPHATPAYVLEAAFELRRTRPRWGAGKIIGHLVHPDWPMPARQVLHKHFVHAGLVKKRRRSRRRPHPGKPTAPFDAPNSIWSADFKGHFKTRDGIYCYPLTVQDGFSRYLLACQGLAGRPTQALAASSPASSMSSACPSGSAPTTACPSPPWPSDGSPGSASGGSSSASCPTSSSQPLHSRTGVTSACTSTSRPRPRSRGIRIGPVALGWLHVRQAAILDHDDNSSRNPKR